MNISSDKPSHNKTIHIIGAGISGLLLGYFFKKNNIHHFEIHEKNISLWW